MKIIAGNEEMHNQYTTDCMNIVLTCGREKSEKRSDQVALKTKHLYLKNIYVKL